MSKPKVLLTRQWPAEAEARAKELFDVTLNEDDQMFGTQGLQRAVKESFDKTLDQSVQHIIERVQAWNGTGMIMDDRTVLAMEICGTKAKSNSR